MEGTNHNPPSLLLALPSNRPTCKASSTDNGLGTPFLARSVTGQPDRNHATFACSEQPQPIVMITVLDLRQPIASSRARSPRGLGPLPAHPVAGTSGKSGNVSSQNVLIRCHLPTTTPVFIIDRRKHQPAGLTSSPSPSLITNIKHQFNGPNQNKGLGNPAPQYSPDLSRINEPTSVASALEADVGVRSKQHQRQPWSGRA